jgi:hypothetical protein
MGVVMHLLGREIPFFTSKLKMRRRTLPQGSPCGVEVSDKEIYLTRSYAKNACFRCLTLIGRFLRSPGRASLVSLGLVDFPSPHEPSLLNKV